MTFMFHLYKYQTYKTLIWGVRSETSCDWNIYILGQRGLREGGREGGREGERAWTELANN